MRHTIAGILCISSLLLSGCNNSPPMEVEQSVSAAENAKVAPGPVSKQPRLKYWWLVWDNPNPAYPPVYAEVYHSTDLSTWVFLGYSTSNQFKIFSNKPYDFYRVRFCLYDPVLCSDWATNQ